MGYLSSLVVATLAVGLSQATPAKRTTDTNPCIELEVPVDVRNNAIHWLQPRVDSTIDAVDWVADMTTWTSPNVTQRIQGQVNINATYKIRGKLCVPENNAKANILQIATHGVGFDKRYWDVEVNPGVYSYTQAALSAGYSIFIYDRLGTGLSDKPDAYDIVQTSVQVDILRALTTFARSGQLLNSTYTRRISTSGNVAHIKDDWKPTKVIHVGHSLGSIITASLLSQTGGISDGAILTGFLFNTQMGGASPATWGFEYARENDPHKFGDRGSGYVVQARRSNVQSSFFKKGKFEPGLLDYAYEIRQPNTVTEFLSIGEVLANLTPNTAFTGPIQFFIGENDYGFCRGDCKGTYDAAAIRKSYYPNSKFIDVHLQPGTGHGLTLSTNATAGYKVIFDYLNQQGV